MHSGFHRRGREGAQRRKENEGFTGRSQRGPGPQLNGSVDFSPSEMAQEIHRKDAKGAKNACDGADQRPDHPGLFAFFLFAFFAPSR